MSAFRFSVIKHLAVLALGLFPVLIAFRADERTLESNCNASLRVRVADIDLVKGVLRVALYDSASDFLSDDAHVLVSAPVTRRGTQEVVFPNVAPGEYAISLFHDINANGRLDKNAIGVPTEAIGFSNNAKVIFGPPSFKEAKFSVRSGDCYLWIRLRDRLF